jgi:ribosomal protein S18 acetylase RimI-like enzyme
MAEYRTDRFVFVPISMERSNSYPPPSVLAETIRQRHQLYLVARVRTCSSSVEKQRKSIGAFHHQWHYGSLPLQACLRFFVLLSNPLHTRAVHAEIGMVCCDEQPDITWAIGGISPVHIVFVLRRLGYSRTITNKFGSTLSNLSRRQSPGSEQTGMPETLVALS